MTDEPDLIARLNATLHLEHSPEMTRGEANDLFREAATALSAARQERDALLEALREEVIRNFAPRATARLSYECTLCDTGWYGGESEQHAHGCLAAQVKSQEKGGSLEPGQATPGK